MFYLKEFFKIIRENLILGAIYICATVGVISTTYFQNDIRSLLSLQESTKTYPYFNALVSENKNLTGVLRRVRNLPGVVNVQAASEKSLGDEVENLKKVFGANLVDSLASVNYKRIKIEVDNELKASSFSLIKEYLARLIGEKSITMGEMKYPKKVKIKKGDFLYTFLKMFDVYAIFVFSGLWLISFLLILKPTLKTAFVVEKFQRKSSVCFKIVFISTLSLVATTFLINYILVGHLNLIAVVATLCMLTFVGVVTLGLKRKYSF
ncbi:MAG: hypothetical protein QF441_06720 [Bacteriovoracaceae bacterium]|jgi:hypothetical protein|nr:hypothetical protein [Halobacteriovoraceae bacterium]MDP7320284.1 hypothetical protein [Bacteriovoracaceae bacterium]